MTTTNNLLPESTWTAPSPYCPRPDLYAAYDGESAEYEIALLIGAFTRAMQPDTVLETGTHQGQTALHIATALHANQHGHLYTCDPDPRFYPDSSALLSGLPATVHLQSSLDLIPTFPPTTPFDLVILDSTFPLRLQELRLLHTNHLLHDRSLILVHDVAPKHGTWADPFFTLDPPPLPPPATLSIIDIPTPRGLAIARYNPTGIPLRTTLLQ